MRILTAEERRQAKGSPSRLAGNFAVKRVVAVGEGAEGSR